MTVTELITALLYYAGDTPVIVDKHSDYTEVTEVTTKHCYNNGGYVSIAYRPEGSGSLGTSKVIYHLPGARS